MNNIDFAKKVLENIHEKSFRLDVSASTGGKCSDGWCDTLELFLDRPQLLYLLHDKCGVDELFEGQSLEEVDVDSMISDMTMEAAWPDGGPAAWVNDVIPDELSELAEELDSLNDEDQNAVKEIRKKLKQVGDGKFTFHFTVKADEYYFTENAEESIELSAKEALGLLYGECDNDDVFEGICDESYDEDLINDKADELNFASDYDYFSYGGECEELEAYLNAWDYILGRIHDGDITEDNLKGWLDYFDDSDNFEMAISKWHDELEEDEF